MDVTRESVRPLLDLQRVDSGIDRLKARLADLPEQRELDEITARFEDAAAAVAERQLILDGLIRDQTKLETEIQQIDDKVEHERARLYSGEISSPKELSNIQAELDALGKRKAHLEDQELEIMEQREEVEKDVADLTAAKDALQASVTEATQRRDTATIVIDAELAELNDERARILPTLVDVVVELYEEIRAKQGGVAVGAYEDGTCRACSLPLSPMAKDEIKRSDEALVRCENCRRLLVFP